MVHDETVCHHHPVKATMVIKLFDCPPIFGSDDSSNVSCILNSSSARYASQMSCSLRWRSSSLWPPAGIRCIDTHQLRRVFTQHPTAVFMATQDSIVADVLHCIVCQVTQTPGSNVGSVPFRGTLLRQFIADDDIIWINFRAASSRPRTSSDRPAPYLCCVDRHQLGDI